MTEKETKKTVKNIIIGFGKGGKTLAKFLGQQGEEVLLVEKSAKMYGGTCINIACLPSKRLILEGAAGSDFSEAVAGKNEMTAQLREKNYQMLAQEETVTVLDGQARLADRLGGAAGGQQLHVARRQGAGQVDQTGFVGNRQQGPAHGQQIGTHGGRRSKRSGGIL